MTSQEFFYLDSKIEALIQRNYIFNSMEAITPETPSDTRGTPSIVVYNGDIYLFGNYYAASPNGSLSAYKFNKTNNSWDLLCKKTGMGYSVLSSYGPGIVFNDKYYFESDYGGQNDGYEFDFKAATPTFATGSVSHMFTTIEWGVLNDELYTAFNYTDSSSDGQPIYKYGSSTVVARIPNTNTSSRRNVISYHGKIHFFGGGEYVSNTYTPNYTHIAWNGSTWETLNDLPTFPSDIVSNIKQVYGTPIIIDDTIMLLTEKCAYRYNEDYDEWSIIRFSDAIASSIAYYWNNTVSYQLRTSGQPLYEDGILMFGNDNKIYKVRYNYKIV